MSDLEQRVKDLEEKVAELEQLLLAIVAPDGDAPTVGEQLQESIKRLRGGA